MKKLILIAAAMMFILALTACGSSDTGTDSGTDSGEVSIDYGKSDLYTQEDMDAAIELIRAEFDSWEGCELHSISYAGDECNTEENIAWMNELADSSDFTQCIEFTSDFHSPVEGGGAWEADQEYTDWQWWLGRAEGGDWELMTWGY